ncbi:MAG: Crp/Fnr family transcriptional regulator [Crocinitomicaceae bacterium]|nr:Crp/Fnr family transcriptional regulator [Crocinitomicaceae bacterium]
MEVQEFFELTKHAFNKEAVHVHHYKKGEYLFTKGHEIEEMYFLLEGELAIEKNKQLIWIAKKNEFIGICSYFIGENNFAYSAKANFDSKIITIEKKEFDRVVQDNSDLRNDLMQLFCQRIDYTLSNIKVFSDLSRKKRIIDFLVRNIESNQKVINQNYELHYSSTQIAEFVHIPKYFTLKFLKELQAKNILKLSSKNITITDFKGLKLLLTLKGVNL